MRLGVYFDGFTPASDMREAAAAAEEAGAASLWFAQHMGHRDAFMSAAAAACVTRKAALVPTAISAYLWPPLVTAMSVATLSELAPDRARIAVAVGNMLNLAQSGVEPVKPIRVIREYVEALRRLLAGDAVELDGEVNKLHGAHMKFLKGVEVPIYVASTGPQMLQLAGEIADGVVLSTGLTLATMRRCLDLAEAGARRKGRDPSAIRRAGFISLAVAEDARAARAAILPKLAFLFRSRNHAENIKSSGLDIDHEAIMAAIARNDFDGAVKLMPERAASVFGVAGTQRECRDRLHEFLSVGLDEPVIEISGTPEARRLALELVRDVTAIHHKSMSG
jgi:5,10-methylenetetrahydromethanopterin reductase